MEDRSRQRVRYLRTPDGVKLAWAECGTGPLLIKAANWLSHLEYDWESPVWRHWLRFFAGHTRFVRYDERGCGMTDWNVGDVSFGRWVDDLELVAATAAPPPERFALLGISQGAAACIAYAAAHPERVSALILYGGYALGWNRRDDAAGMREFQAIIELTKLGWGKDNPAYREVFTSRFIPGGTRAQLDWFNDLCRKTSTPEIAAELLQTRSAVDVAAALEQVQAPTLVLHARHDAVVPIAWGRHMASGIPGAEFVELDTKNHILLEDEPAWDRFRGAVLDFLKLGAPGAQAEDPAFAALTARERGILALITEGLSNAEIAERLSLSEKTVRNHTSSVFDKLGVWTRAQAMVFARDRGFRG
jgi:pimeloyl-ACP methyl ester carboxylesterase/DNA-binding CsgD family transcriptional regulator